MAALAAFIDHADAPKHDLMNVALAHQRCAWARPFINGNGRAIWLHTKPNVRQYTIGFAHNMLLRGVVRPLTDDVVNAAARSAPPAPGSAV